MQRKCKVIGEAMGKCRGNAKGFGKAMGKCRDNAKGFGEAMGKFRGNAKKLFWISRNSSKVPKAVGKLRSQLRKDTTSPW
jgi:hypothetical protein